MISCVMANRGLAIGMNYFASDCCKVHLMDIDCDMVCAKHVIINFAIGQSHCFPLTENVGSWRFDAAFWEEIYVV